MGGIAELLVPDDLWAATAPLLPPGRPKPEGGRPPVPDRSALSGILFVLKTGLLWEYLPAGMGGWVWLNRFRRLTIRYERREDIYLAFTTLGCPLVCLNQARRFCWMFLARLWPILSGLMVVRWRSGWCVKLACPRQETPPCPACRPASPRSS